MESWILPVSCKVSEALHVNFVRDPNYSWFLEQIKNWIYFFVLTFYYKYLKFKNNFNLGIKTVLYLKYNRINGFVGVQNGKAEQPVWTRTANRANKRLVLQLHFSCGSPSITTPVSLLANELLDARSVLHGQVNLAAANQIRVNHVAMNGC